MQNPGYTQDDWAQWEGRWELIQGIAYDMAPASSYTHQHTSMTLSVRLFTALENAKSGKEKGDCQVLAAPIDVFLDQDNVVQPDLVIVCDPGKISERGIHGAPDLVVEILSPGTAAKDMNQKWWLYESFGVPEYLIIDPESRTARLLRLEGNRYQDAARASWGGSLSLLAGRITLDIG